MPRICDYVSKRDIADVIKGLRSLDRPNGSTGYPKREARGSRQRHGGRVEVGAEERHLKTTLLDSETGRNPKPRTVGSLQRVGKGRNGTSPKASRRKQP